MECRTRLSCLRAINFGRQGPASGIQGGLKNVSPELFDFSVGGSFWKNNNVIDIDWRSASTHQTLLLQKISMLSYCFNNYSSAGRFVPGTDRSANERWEGGIRTVVNDAMAVALL